MSTDDDIDFLADDSGDIIKIISYLGPLNSGIWYELQIPHKIPQDTAEF